MKREHIARVTRIDKDLSAMESRLAHFQHVDKLHIQSACCMELADYPEPSRIGATFRAVRAVIVQQLEGEIAEARRELEQLGVDAS